MNTIYTDEFIHARIKDYAYEIIGPVMYNYTEWVLYEAAKRGISRLYFLARDGYLLCKIAKRICVSRNIKIECRYLYCSRQALRIPSYHVIGEEAFDLLLLDGYYVTPKTILERAMLDDSEMVEIVRQLNIPDINHPFNDRELEEFKAIVRSNEFYRDAVLKKSRAAYATTIEYFKQEGLFETDNVAIVDSGWAGSMQRSLCQLLRSAGYNGKLLGFYFGMYSTPNALTDSEYLTFYFNARSGAKRKAAFCNNLFECMLSAPHPMTIGYVNNSDSIAPIFADQASEKQDKLIDSQINGVLEYVDSAIKKNDVFALKKAQKTCYKILKKAMMYPTQEFATIYGAFNFCDDVTEGYHMVLADPARRRSLRNYILISRIAKKLFKIKKANATELFWPYGVITFCPAILRPWYRINVYSWELLKALLKKQ